MLDFPKVDGNWQLVPQPVSLPEGAPFQAHQRMTKSRSFPNSTTSFQHAVELTTRGY
jgi:hypothetical protein